VQKRIQVVADAFVEAVEFAAFFFGQEAVAAEWRQQSRSEWGVNLFEQFEEYHADGVALADQLVATECGIFSTSPLARNLERS